MGTHRHLLHPSGRPRRIRRRRTHRARAHEGDKRIKLPAGDAILCTLAAPFTRWPRDARGARLASFFWVESMVRSTEQRRLLFDMDMACCNCALAPGARSAVVRLTGTYHNLLRMWADS